MLLSSLQSFPEYSTCAIPHLPNPANQLDLAKQIGNRRKLRKVFRKMTSISPAIHGDFPRRFFSLKLVIKYIMFLRIELREYKKYI